jgi:hypothetical protein
VEHNPEVRNVQAVVLVVVVIVMKYFVVRLEE